MKKTKKENKKNDSLRDGKQIFRLIANLSITLIYLLVVIVLAQLIVGYLMIAIIGRDNLEQPMFMALYSVLYYVLSLIVIVFLTPKLVNCFKRFYGKHHKSKWATTRSRVMTRKEIGLDELPTWGDIGLAPIGFIIYLILAGAFTFVFSQFEWFNVSQAQDVGFQTGIMGADRIIAYIILVVVAPIVEEILFRGWLYSKLRTRLSRETTVIAASSIAAVLVSLLFGFVHGQWNVGVNVFAMSLVLCAMREITGTVYSGIILHMLKNGIAFYFLYVLGIQ